MEKKGILFCYADKEGYAIQNSENNKAFSNQILNESNSLILQLDDHINGVDYYCYEQIMNYSVYSIIEPGPLDSDGRRVGFKFAIFNDNTSKFNDDIILTLHNILSKYKEIFRNQSNADPDSFNELKNHFNDTIQVTYNNNTAFYPSNRKGYYIYENEQELRNILSNTDLKVYSKIYFIAKSNFKPEIPPDSIAGLEHVKSFPKSYSISFDNFNYTNHIIKINDTNYDLPTAKSVIKVLENDKVELFYSSSGDKISAFNFYNKDIYNFGIPQEKKVVIVGEPKPEQKFIDEVLNFFKTYYLEFTITIVMLLGIFCLFTYFCRNPWYDKPIITIVDTIPSEPRPLTASDSLDNRMPVLVVKKNTFGLYNKFVSIDSNRWMKSDKKQGTYTPVETPESIKFLNDTFKKDLISVEKKSELSNSNSPYQQKTKEKFPCDDYCVELSIFCKNNRDKINYPIISKKDKMDLKKAYEDINKKYRSSDTCKCPATDKNTINKLKRF